MLHESWHRTKIPKQKANTLKGETEIPICDAHSSQEINLTSSFQIPRDSQELNPKYTPSLLPHQGTQTNDVCTAWRRDWPKALTPRELRGGVVLTHVSHLGIIAGNSTQIYNSAWTNTNRSWIKAFTWYFTTYSRYVAFRNDNLDPEGKFLKSGMEC